MRPIHLMTNLLTWYPFETFERRMWRILIATYPYEHIPYTMHTSVSPWPSLFSFKTSSTPTLFRLRVLESGIVSLAVPTDRTLKSSKPAHNFPNELKIRTSRSTVIFVVNCVVFRFISMPNMLSLLGRSCRNVLHKVRPSGKICHTNDIQ